MRDILLATDLLLVMLAVASFCCAVLSPADSAAWAISEISTVLAVLFAYFYAADYP